MIFLSIKNLTKSYQDYFANSAIKYVLKNVNLNIAENQILALVGESGSGKTTLAKCLLGFTQPDEGIILFKDRNLLTFTNKQQSKIRTKFQMIFQNPENALNPKQRIKSCLTEPIKKHFKLNKSELERNVFDLLEKVELERNILQRFPHELSGGQQQRVVIARALTVNPEFLIADEPTSSLDAIHKYKILDLLKNLQQQLGMTLLLITHDLNTVKQYAHRVAVIYKGEVVECATCQEIFTSQSHWYTKELLNSTMKHAITIEKHQYD